MVWYNANWHCRKSHVIQSATGAGTNYPVRIHVHYGAPVDDGGDNDEDVYLNGFCKPDFGDIRFTKSDGSTLLSYWMDSKEDAKEAVFWVKMTDDLSTSNRTIYIYYSNPYETSESNQFTTGITQLREQKWLSSYNPNVTYSIENGTWLKINSTQSGLGPGWAFMVVPKSWINGKYLRWSWQGTWDYPEYSYEWSVRIYDGDYTRSNDDDFPLQGVPVSKGQGLLQNYDRTANYTFGPETIEFQVNVSSAQKDFVTIFLYLRDAWIADWMYGLWDFIEVNQNSGGSGNISRIHFDTSVRMEKTGSTGDYGLVRKYVSPEPQHGSWGSIEITGTIEVGSTALVTGYASKNTTITSSADPIIRVINNASDAIQTPLIENMVFEGNGNNTGIEIKDVYGCQTRNVTVKNCSIGIKMKNVSSWTEGTNITHVRLMDVGKGIVFEKGGGGADQRSFAYTHIEDVGISLKNTTGCTGIEVGADCKPYSSFIKANVWMQYSDSKGMHIKDTETYSLGEVRGGLVNLYVSKLGSTGGTGLYLDSDPSTAVWGNQGKFFLIGSNLSSLVNRTYNPDEIRAISV